MIKIRQCSRDDLNRLIEIEKRFGEVAFGRRRLLNHIKSPNSIFLAAEVNGIISGNVILSFRKNTSITYIESIVVAEEYEGKGIATELLDHCTMLSRQMKGKTKIKLEVATNNLRAIDVYTKNGFTITYIRYKYYIDGNDAYTMYKTL